MNRKLNYIFSQVIENYKEAYKGNRAFYIAFGLLFIAINVGIYIGIYALEIRFFQRIIPEYNTTYLLYAYLLLLILPCLMTLQEKEGSLKFLKMLSQNIKTILGIIGLAVGGLFLIGVCKSLVDDSIFASFGPLLGIIGNVLTIFVILSLLRNAIQQKITFFDSLMEAFVIAVLLFAIIREFLALYSYELWQSFSFILGSDLGEIILTPVLFVLLNLLLSPLLVCILTTVVRYEQATEVIIETTNNEEF